MSTKELLNEFKNGRITVDEVLKLLTYDDAGFAKLDHARKHRTGYPEVIYGEGKTCSQAAEIFERLALAGNTVICTRSSEEMFEAVKSKTASAVYHKQGRLITTPFDTSANKGLVAIATGGTADIPVAEEAAAVLEAYGSKVERLYDVGVAGVHRLFAQKDTLDKANCVIAVAGMEGALPSVVAGMVKVPVIAVPTSIGYGANLGGITALMAMLCSCASGVSVVNIDNGFGAAVQADMINKLAVR